MLMIDWIGFYAVSAIFQPCNGGKAVMGYHAINRKNAKLPNCTILVPANIGAAN